MAVASPKENQAIVAVLGAVLVFSIIELFIKRLAAVYPLQQVVFLRVVSSLPLIAAVFWYSTPGLRLGGLFKTLFTTQRPGLHLLRCVFSTVSTVCIFYALSAIPLGTAAALTSTSPLFLLAFSPLLLAEGVGLRRWFGVLVGFAGVCLIAGPQAASSWLGMGSALVGAITSAAVMVCLRLLGGSESAAHTSLLNALGMSVLAMLAVLTLGWLPIRPEDALDIVALGLLGALGHLVITWSYRHAQAGALAPLGFTATIWAALFGYLFWGEWPSLLTGLGMLAIIVGGVLATRR